MKKIFLFIVLSFTLLSCVKRDQEWKQFFSKKETRVLERKREDVIEIGDWQEEFSTAEDKRSTKVKVAILVPLSGQAQKIGHMMLQAAELAVFEDRRDNIQLRPYDTKGTAFGALDAINQAIKDRVDIVIGPLFSSSTEAIINRAYENNLPVLSFSNNQLLQNNKNVYLMGFMPEQEIERIVSYAMNQGKTSFSALVTNDDYGALVSKILKETVAKKDGKIVKIDYYSNRDTALHNKIKNLIDSYAISDRVYEEYEAAKEFNRASEYEDRKPVEFIYDKEDRIYADAILIVDGGIKLNQILDLMDQYSVRERPYQLLGTSKWENELNYKNENLLNAWFTSADPEEYSKFEERFYKVYNTFPIRVASLAYDAINVVKRTYSRSKNETIDKNHLMNQRGFKGIDGYFRFLPNGIVERNFSVLEIREGYARVIDPSLKGFLNY
jgi:branched-chain amino acid transport system substrate-binding protein